MKKECSICTRVGYISCAVCGWTLCVDHSKRHKYHYIDSLGICKICKSYGREQDKGEIVAYMKETLNATRGNIRKKACIVCGAEGKFTCQECGYTICSQHSYEGIHCRICLSPHSVSDTLRDGYVIGKYEIIEILNKNGSTGTLYKGRDAKNNSVAALKIYREHLSDDKKFTSDFKKIMHSLVDLEHPNLISVYQAGEFKKRIYCAMEFVEGKSLPKTLKEMVEQRPFVELIISLIEALQYIQDKVDIPSAIFPNNIVIVGKQAKFVGDIALYPAIGEHWQRREAKRIVTRPSAFYVLDSDVCYVSPEELQNEEIDIRSTIFSLGSVWYYLLSEQHPHIGDSHLDLAAKVISQQPKTISSFYPQISPEVSKIMCKMLEKDPKDRYQNLSELLEDLQKVQNHQKEFLEQEIIQNRTKDTAITIFSLEKISLKKANIWIESGNIDKFFSTLEQLPQSEFYKMCLFVLWAMAQAEKTDNVYKLLTCLQERAKKGFEISGYMIADFMGWWACRVANILKVNDIAWIITQIDSHGFALQKAIERLNETKDGETLVKFQNVYTHVLNTKNQISLHFQIAKALIKADKIASALQTISQIKHNKYKKEALEELSQHLVKADIEKNKKDILYDLLELAKSMEASRVFSQIAIAKAKLGYTQDSLELIQKENIDNSEKARALVEIAKTLVNLTESQRNDYHQTIATLTQKISKKRLKVQILAAQAHTLFKCKENKKAVDTIKQALETLASIKGTGEIPDIDRELSLFNIIEVFIENKLPELNSFLHQLVESANKIISCQYGPNALATVAKVLWLYEEKEQSILLLQKAKDISKNLTIGKLEALKHLVKTYIQIEEYMQALTIIDEIEFRESKAQMLLEIVKKANKKSLFWPEIVKRIQAIEQARFTTEFEEQQILLEVIKIMEKLEKKKEAREIFAHLLNQVYNITGQSERAWRLGILSRTAFALEPAPQNPLLQEIVDKIKEIQDKNAQFSAITALIHYMAQMGQEQRAIGLFFDSLEFPVCV